MRSQERLDRVEAFTDLPLTILAIILIPLLIVPEITDLSSRMETAFIAGDWLIWAAFTVDYIVKFSVAPQRWHFVTHHIFEGLTVFLPFLRPIRAVRALRLVRLGVLLGLNVQLIEDIAGQRATRSVGLIVLGVLVSGAILTLLAERDAEGANIETLNDALWWGISTMTTVGYGDTYPVTPLGRGIAVVLMILGIAALSAMTATIAAYLVREHEDVHLADVLNEVRALRAQLDAMNAESAARQAGGGAGGL